MTEKEFDRQNEDFNAKQSFFDDDTDCENKIRLNKIDELTARTKLSFSEAKEVLKEYDYDLIEALAAVDLAEKQRKAENKQKIGEKYNDAKDFGYEQYEKLKTAGVEGYNDIKEKIKNTDFKEDFKDVYNKTKEVIGTPVKIGKTGKKLPAGVVGAGFVALLYPLHKSKGAAAVGLGAVGAWAVAKQKNNEQLKGMVGNFGRNFSESFGTMNQKESDCFTVKVDKNDIPVDFECKAEENAKNTETPKNETKNNSAEDNEI